MEEADIAKEPNAERSQAGDLAKTNIIRETRAAVEQRGVESLAVNDLTKADLHRIEWAGGPLHAKSVGEALTRSELGQVDYLAVRSSGGFPVSIGGVDYVKHEGAGFLWQLATLGELQGLGLGSGLIQEAEQRIRQRGLDTATLSVEIDNPRAKSLYGRLGYIEYGQEQGIMG